MLTHSSSSSSFFLLPTQTNRSMGFDIFAGSDPNVSDDDFTDIKINEKFARQLEHNKKREDLHRLQELKKRGLVKDSDGESSDSSDDDDDDDDDEDLVPTEKELAYLDALLRVKKQDPILNQKDAKLFSDSDDDEEVGKKKKKKKEKKEKALYLKDVNYKHLTEDGPEFGEKEVRRNAKVYDSNQEENIRALLDAEKAAFEGDDDDDDDDDIIKEKEKEKGKGKGNGMDEEEGEDEMVVEREKRYDEYFGEDDNLDENERFLKTFLRNKMWVDKEKEKRLSYDDIGVSEDEDELDKQDEYEAKFNFRHEEVEGDRILGHARFTEGSVRKKTNNRKEQRKSKEERMAQAEKERKEELKRLKNLKKKEIQEKLEKFQAVSGVDEDRVVKLGVDDLEEDFDPEAYDKKMREIFDDDYYGAEDEDPGFGSGGEGDIEKPDFGKEDELLGLPKDWDLCGSKDGFGAVRERVLKQKEKEEEEEEPVKEDGKRKRKRKIPLKEKVELDKQLEEYYKLDYEDTIGGDLKTRFKYKIVQTNPYGLRPEEILIADDKDLNQYVSMKRLAPYREKEWEVTYHQKLKKDLILGGGKSDGKIGKKHKMKEDSSVAETSKKLEEYEEVNGDTKPISRRMRRRQRQNEVKLSKSRLEAYGIMPNKVNKKH